MKTSTMTAGLLGCLGLGMVFHAEATQRERYDYQSAVGICQGNSAVYGSNLRARPLSTDNIGTTNQFISCGMQGDDSTGRGADSVFVRVYNGDTVAHDVQCILVDGYRAGGAAIATYTTKTVTLAAGATDTITWVPADIATAPAKIYLPQLQCLLPSGTALQYTGKDYSEVVKK